MTATTVLHCRLDLPRWDTAWEVKATRAGKLLRHRRVWDALWGNARTGHWRQRHNAAREVIEAVTLLARSKGLHRVTNARHVTVELVWSPGDHRRADDDNLWHLLKVASDALARGRNQLPGLCLVPDDTARWVTKTARIARPPEPAGLWLDITITTPEEVAR